MGAVSLTTGPCDPVAEKVAACAVDATEVEVPTMAHAIRAAVPIRLRIIVRSVRSVSSSSGIAGVSDNSPTFLSYAR